MGQFVDLLKLQKREYGRLKLLSFYGMSDQSDSMWLCVCTCGKETVVKGQSLRNGHTQSCGCLNKDRVIARQLKHGHARRTGDTPEYAIWHSLRYRCNNRNFKQFLDYGGRGIKVCERWNTSFENFILDMGLRPSPMHTIDRIDNDKGYSKENCRWTTRRVQALNKRKPPTSITGVTGVRINNNMRNKFQAFIHIDNKSIYLGSFGKIDDAIHARRNAEEKYHKPILDQAML